MAVAVPYGAWAPFPAAQVRPHEWLEIGLPIATGLISAFAGVYALSGKANTERLRTVQFALAVASIGFAFTSSVIAVQKVSERLAATGAVMAERSG